LRAVVRPVFALTLYSARQTSGLLVFDGNSRKRLIHRTDLQCPYPTDRVEFNAMNPNFKTMYGPNMELRLADSSYAIRGDLCAYASFAFLLTNCHSLVKQFYTFVKRKRDIIRV
jgi:hypothetical protein